jgi:hypothetical protein
MVDGGIALRPIIDDHMASLLLIHRLLYQPVTKRSRASSTKKKAPSSFKGGASLNSTIFILRSDNVSATRSKYFHCSVRFSLYPTYVWAGTGRTPLFIDHSYSVSSPPSMHISHWSNSEVPCSLQKDRRQRLHVMKVILTRSPASHR